MDLVTPGFGLVFWTTLSFLLILFLLGKFAWKPILKSIKEREDTIQDALEAAERAKDEMRKLKESNDALLQEAREFLYNVTNSFPKQNVRKEKATQGGIFTFEEYTF